MVGEEAVDEGGVLKEFFMLISRELLTPDYGMFKYYEESRLLWFNEDVSLSIFRLFCRICHLSE